MKSYAYGMGHGMAGMAPESQQMMAASYPAEPQTQTTQTETLDPEEILEQFAQLWYEDEQLREMISEHDWLKFIKAIEKSLKKE